MKIIRIILILVFGWGLSVMSLCAEEQEESGIPQAVKSEDISVNGNVTLDFKEADIRSVLRIISYKAGVNVVATPEVMGAVTIRLVEVPWENALDTIVKTYGFGYEWLNKKVIMVSTLEKLAEQRKVQEEAAEKEPLDTQSFPLNFSKVEDVKLAVEKLVSERGKITIEIRTNTLIMTDTKTNLNKIAKVVGELDRITPQVLIEARIVETTLNDTDKLGIKWTVSGTVQGSARPTTFPFATDSNSKYLPDDILAPNKLPDVAGSLFKLGTLDASGTTAVLDMLFTTTDSEMLSNPRIVTLDNKPAVIEVVTLDPTPQWSYNKDTNDYVMTNYRQEKYGIILKVTPQINKLGYVTLNLEPEVSEWLRDKTLAGGSGLSVDLPVIYRQTTSTTVMVKDGNTLVIGGLIKNKTTDTVQKVPFLGDIPILGMFFKHRTKTVEKKDLIIFITPKILTIQDY